MPDLPDSRPFDFERYVQERYRAQLAWYDKKSLHNHRMFNLFQGLVVACAAVLPVLSADLIGEYRWITVGISTVLAVMIGLLNLFKYQEKWIRQRSSCERLKREWYYYAAGVHDYATLSSPERQHLFVERTERLIEGEQIEWQKEHGYRADELVHLLRSK
jgi:uncharacterized protein DUF4231